MCSSTVRDYHSPPPKNNDPILKRTIVLFWKGLTGIIAATAVDDIPSSRIATQDVWLRVKVHSKGIANQIQAIAEWSYSLDGKKFTKIGNPFTVREGKWIGAKLGFFNTRTAKKNDAAFFDVDWIHFEK